MSCCIPPLSRIPSGKFYCFDCSPMGTTSQLVDYFQHHETRKDEHERLVLQQSFVSRKKKTTTPSSSSHTATSHANVKPRRKSIPVVHSSFIDTLLREDIIAESLDKDPATTATTGGCGPAVKTKGTSRSRVSPEGGDEEDKTLMMLPISELAHINHEHLIGKPVRLYCPNMNAYHNGRILDTREKTRSSTGSSNCTDNESIAALVRFPAGKDNRKTTLTQWMYLEEHCLAVSSDVVWAWMGGDTAATKKKKAGDTAHWTHGKLWRRSSRELVPVMKLLSEEEGQIRFRPSVLEGQRSHDTTNNSASDEKKSSKSLLSKNDSSSTSPSPVVPQWGLVESFDGVYELLNLAEETKLDTPTSGPKLNDPIRSGLAKVELEEQRRVQWWKTLPLNDPFLTLRAQDPPSLEFEMPVEKEWVRPSSLVDLGLDREMMLKLVSQHWGVEPTKDMGVSLACETVDCLASVVHRNAPAL